MKRLPIYIALTLLAVAAFSGCSTKKNTASSRFWQSFVTRYNVYYNGSEAYKEGCLAKEQGNKDNYTEMLPYFLVGNEKSRDLGKSNFETAITKCEKAIQLHSIKKKPVVNPSKRRSPKMKAYLSRQEFNPFLKNAWLLMGRAQFQKGDFIEAASTFSYIARHYAPEPLVAAEARTWLARCYAQLDWFYDAEDALDKARRDTLNNAIRREMLFTETDLLLRQQRYAEALPLLQQAAKKEKRKQQKARLYFLLGQVNLHLDKKREAAEALRKCIKQSPPYELSFNARILQTEAFTSPDEARSMVKRLRRMARDGSNKDYLDQVYYAMGNIHLTLGDTAQAIGSYETGRAKSTRGGAEKGMLLLRLGELYWERGRYDLAQSCYGEAVGLLDKTHEAYEETMRRSKVLDELVPFTSAVHLQDSLQQLALMSEEERNAAIDRTIELLKRKEEAEREAREDSAAEARMQENAAAGGTTRPTTQTGQTAVGGNKEWYFYNPMLVMQGKQDFKKRWGNRKLEDNWRRSNRTVVPMDDMAGVDYEAEDSIRLAEERADSLALAEEEAAAQPDSAQNDPHRREYYLKDIPFTPEAKAASDLIIMDGLYNAGLIEKDKLEDFPLAARTLTRLADQYPTFEKMDDVFYQLFLLYSRWGQADKAAEMKARMAQLFPESALTTLITDPDYERYARYGRQIEDSLYTATYEAYRRRDNATVARNFEESTRRFPTGANRPKFMFVHILSRIGHEDTKQIRAHVQCRRARPRFALVAPHGGCRRRHRQRPRGPPPAARPRRAVRLRRGLSHRQHRRQPLALRAGALQLYGLHGAQLRHHALARRAAHAVSRGRLQQFRRSPHLCPASLCRHNAGPHADESPRRAHLDPQPGNARHAVQLRRLPQVLRANLRPDGNQRHASARHAGRSRRNPLRGRIYPRAARRHAGRQRHRGRRRRVVLRVDRRPAQAKINVSALSASRQWLFLFFATRAFL